MVSSYDGGYLYRYKDGYVYSRDYISWLIGRAGPDSSVCLKGEEDEGGHQYRTPLTMLKAIRCRYDRMSAGVTCRIKMKKHHR